MSQAKENQSVYYFYRQNQTKHQIYASVNPEYSSIGMYEPDEYEIPAENIELLKEIGHGHFGKVGLVCHLYLN